MRPVLNRFHDSVTSTVIFQEKKRNNLGGYELENAKK
jgi:hypothetical protein